jgi:hypothetical protein
MASNRTDTASEWIVVEYTICIGRKASASAAMSPASWPISMDTSRNNTGTVRVPAATESHTGSSSFTPRMP